MNILCKLGRHKWQHYSDTITYGSTGKGGYDNMTIEAEGYCERDCGIADTHLSIDYEPLAEHKILTAITRKKNSVVS